MEVKINKNLSERALEDYEIVKRAVKGDEKACTQLVNRYTDSIFHMMLKMIHNREDANDLTQEAFSKAFHKLHMYAPKYAFSTWLFKIAINNCIDSIRKKKIQVCSLDEPMEPDGNQNYLVNLKAPNLNPEQDYIRTQKLKETRHILRQMSTKYRLMIELRYYEEMTYDQISKMLEIPLGTVKAQLFRAKEILHSKLEISRKRGQI